MSSLKHRTTVAAQLQPPHQDTKVRVDDPPMVDQCSPATAEQESQIYSRRAAAATDHQPAPNPPRYRVAMVDGHLLRLPIGVGRYRVWVGGYKYALWLNRRNGQIRTWHRVVKQGLGDAPATSEPVAIEPSATAPEPSACTGPAAAADQQPVPDSPRYRVAMVDGHLMRLPIGVGRYRVWAGGHKYALRLKRDGQIRKWHRVIKEDA